MISSRIESDILVEAPIDVVWKVVTEPEHMRLWFADDVDIDVRAGGDGTLVFRDRATKNETTAAIRVEVVAPPHSFSFRWMQPDGEKPHAGNSLRVEFTLTSEGPNTRVRVVEIGLDELGWQESRKASYRDDHNRGWSTHLGRLRECAPRTAS